MSCLLISRRRTLLVAALAAVASALTISACSTDPSAPSDNLAVTLAPTTISVAQGGTGTSTASITRGGAFAGPVTMSASGAPSGVTVSFSPGLIAAGSTSAGVTVAVDAAVPAGNKTITISAAGTGVATATTTLTVVVTSASGGGNFTVAFCAAEAPIWVAAQDGAGAWTRVTPSSGSTYQIAFASGKGGVAVVDTVGTDNELSIFYGTVAEFTVFGGSGSSGCGTKTVNGTVANVGASEVATMTLGYSSATTSPSLPAFPAFVLPRVANGSLDLVATRGDLVSGLNKIILRRSQDIADGGSLALVDFNSAEAFAPATANVTVTGLGSDQMLIFNAYTGLNGSTFASLGAVTGYTSASGAVPIGMMPLAKLNTGELQVLTTSGHSASNSGAARTAGVYFHTPANQTIALGPLLSTPTVSKLVTAPTARPRMQLPVQAQYNRIVSALYEQSSPTRSVSIEATAGYFGTAPATWDITVPDLSPVAGWLPAWGLLDGNPIDWEVDAQGGTLSFLDPNIADGATYQLALLQSNTPLALRPARRVTGVAGLQRRLVDVLREQSQSPLH